MDFFEDEWDATSPHSKESSSQGFPHGDCLNQCLSQIDNEAYVCNRDLAALYPISKASVDVQKRLRKSMSQSLGARAKPCLTSRGGFRLRPTALPLHETVPAFLFSPCFTAASVFNGLTVPCFLTWR